MQQSSAGLKNSNNRQRERRFRLTIFRKEQKSKS